MDDHRNADALNDTALDRDIEASLAVDPSPEFVARVRARVQHERVAAMSPRRWQIAAAFALVAVTVLIVGVSRKNGARVAEDDSPGRREPRVAREVQDMGPSPIANDSTPLPAFGPAATTTPRKSAGTRRRSTAPVGEPELLIAADEARALTHLFSNARKGLLDLSSLQDATPGTAALQPPSEIAFPPIRFESIAPEGMEQGEPQ